MGGLGSEARGAGGWVPDRHPVMPNLVVLWKMSPLGRGVRAGATGLWARGSARRSWVATGPKPKPGGAGGAPGPLVGEGRRPAQGLLFKPPVRLSSVGQLDMC
jgi:hypothetical protein